MRQIDTEALELIGKGTTARVYLLSEDEVIKVFYPFIGPEDIHEYFEVTQRLEEAGVKVAKAKELVKAGDGLGIIYERVAPGNVADMIFRGIREGDMTSFEKWTDYYVQKARQIHAIRFPEGTFADIRERYSRKLDVFAGMNLSGKNVPRLKEFLFSIPKSCNYLHGDLNPTNIIIGEKERLIDAGEAALGEDLFDFAYAASIDAFFEKIIPGFAEKHYQVSAENIRRFYDLVIDRYYDDRTAEEKKDIREKLRVIGIIYGVTMNLGSGDYMAQIRMAADTLIEGLW